MEITKEAIKIAKKAGKILQREAKRGIQVREKAENDFVTQADIASEKAIIKAIQKKFPEHGIIAEESEETTVGEYIWIIDPLDGTMNYAFGLPIYSISIGIFKAQNSKSSKNFDFLEGELVAGVVYAPALGELFHAEKGGGAFLNGKRIEVSKRTKVKEGMSATGFPATEKLNNMPYFEKMVHKARAVRRLGSAALDLAYVAAGRLDHFWEFGLSAWDIAAGVLILQEAGGLATDTNGQTLDLFGADILATNSHIHPEAIRLFQNL